MSIADSPLLSMPSLDVVRFPAEMHDGGCFSADTGTIFDLTECRFLGKDAHLSLLIAANRDPVLLWLDEDSGLFRKLRDRYQDAMTYTGSPCEWLIQVTDKEPR